MKKISLLVSLALLLVSACNFPGLDQPSAGSQEDSLPLELATPYAQSPAAGICGRAEGLVVEIFLEPGLPNPRCIQMGSGQFLTVTNHTGETVTIALANEGTVLLPDQSFTFARSLDEMLAVGVHQLDVDPCCGGEIMMVGE